MSTRLFSILPKWLAAMPWLTIASAAAYGQRTDDLEFAYFPDPGERNEAAINATFYEEAVMPKEKAAKVGDKVVVSLKKGDIQFDQGSTLTLALAGNRHIYCESVTKQNATKMKKSGMHCLEDSDFDGNADQYIFKRHTGQKFRQKKAVPITPTALTPILQSSSFFGPARKWLTLISIDQNSIILELNQTFFELKGWAKQPDIFGFSEDRQSISVPLHNGIGKIEFEGLVAEITSVGDGTVLYTVKSGFSPWVTMENETVKFILSDR